MIKQEPVDKLAVRLATNDANMIGSLNLEVARLQELNQSLQDQIKEKDRLIVELTHQNENLRKRGDTNGK